MKHYLTILFLVILNWSFACDGMSASVLSNVYMGNNQYQVTIQYCESVSNGAGAAVSGIILQSSGVGTITGTTTPSFTSNSTGVVINYNAINANTVQWGEWDDNPNVPNFLNNGNATQCFTMVLNTNGPVTSFMISGSSGSSNLGAGFVNWMGRFCCRMTITVPPVTCNSAWTAPTICPGSGPIDLDNSTSLTGVFSGPGVNSATGVFNPSSTSLPATITFTVGDAGLSCSTIHTITSPYSITPVNDQTICAGQSVNLTTSASTSLPCNYTLNLQDSWGDGWQGGANVNVYINGVLLGNYTLASGSASNITLPVSTGDVITLNYTAGSSFNSENRVRIANPAGTYVYTSNWGPSSGSMGAGITANCGTNTSFTYAWTPTTGLSTSTAATTVATPAATTTYTVTATNTVTGCVLTEPVTITVQTSATPTFTAVGNFCQGATAPVLPATSTNGIAGTWSPATISTATPGTFNFTFTPTVTACTANATMAVTIYALPAVNAGVDQTICQGAATSLTATGTTSYSWTGGITQGGSFTPPVGNSTYTVTGTNASGCTQTDAVTITVMPSVVLDAGPDVSICAGQSTILTATGGSNYTWSPAINLNTTTGANVMANPPSTQTYTVTETGSLACSTPDQVTVTILANAPIDAGLDVAICAGDFTTLVATGGATYTWSPAIGLTVTSGNSVDASPAATQVYTVTGTNAGGCIGTDQVTVTISPQPAVNAGADQTVCIGTAVTLTGSGADSYSWSNGVVDGIAFTPPVGTTIYTLTGINAGLCDGTDVVSITVHPLPTIFAGNDVAVCEGLSVTLTASGASSYSWVPAAVSQGVTFVPPNGVSSYTVTGTSSAGCISSDVVNVTVNPNPVATFTNGPTAGCAPFTTSLTNTTANATNCTWTLSNGTVINGCGTVPVTFTQAGCYDVTLTTTSAGGCTSSATVIDLFCVEEDPMAAFSTNGATTISTLNTEVTFQNNSTGASSYQWDFGTGTGGSTEINPTQFFPENGTNSYLVTLVATSSLGCTDTAYYSINVEEELIYYIPNTFTPDNDDYNPTFQPVFTSGFDPQDYNLFIYNRWGELIFESHNAEIGWDGSYGNGREIELCQDGTYIWKIEFKTTNNDKRIMDHGHFSLIR
ncbi:MAG: PKD domain-containing protein [Bacteroidota bacterium]